MTLEVSWYVHGEVILCSAAATSSNAGRDAEKGHLAATHEMQDLSRQRFLKKQVLGQHDFHPESGSAQLRSLSPENSAAACAAGAVCQDGLRCDRTAQPQLIKHNGLIPDCPGNLV
jgi:hypothetical protein